MTAAAARPSMPLVVALAAGLAAVALGHALTDAGAWYRALAKPSWQPPEWVFGPVWLAILLCTAVSVSLAWKQAPSALARRALTALLSCNVVFAVAWSFLFFRLHRPDWALADVVLLWLSIAGLIAVCGRLSRAAGFLLAPYLAWVSVAAAINVAIVGLNGPFGGAA